MNAHRESLASPSAAAASDQPQREPQLFRFRLRQLFFFVSGCAVLGGGMTLVGQGWATALGFVTALIVAHVVATMIGTRLRDSSEELQRWRASRGAPEERPANRGPLTAGELAALASTPLAAHEPPSGRAWWALGVGLLTGGFLGAACIPLLAGPDVTRAGLALGAVSCGVMGAWLALLVSHFYTIVRRTWQHAQWEPGAANRPRRRWFRFS